VPAPPDESSSQIPCAISEKSVATVMEQVCIPPTHHIAATNTQKVKMATLDRLDGPRTGPI
jgi:hypothetical protein